MSTIQGTVSPAKTTLQNISGSIGTPSNVSANVNYNQTANPSNNHAMLLNRDARDQHTIESISGLEEILNQVDEKMLKMIDDWSMDDEGFLYLRANGEVVVGPIGPFNTGTGGSGPGGGGGYTYTITITNLLDSRVITVAEGERVVLKFNYSSTDEESIDDGPGLGQVIVGGVVRQPFSANQGPNEIDVTEFLTAGTNNVTIRIANSENNSKPLAYTVTVAAVSLASSFDPSVPYSGAIYFPYTPTGIAEKTVHFELDGVEIGTSLVSASGRQQSYTIPAQGHGSHVLRVWFTCMVSGIAVSSNILYYSIICTVDGNATPIIAVTSPPLTGVEQNSNIVKKYRVYNPASLNSAITLEVDGDVIATLNVDRTEQTWTYRADKVGEITQTIRCGDIYISWTQMVTESKIDVEAESEALALYLDSYGRSNNEDNPGTWESEAVKCEFHNFNFVSDGWVQDDDDLTVLRVTGDARLVIPYKMFAYDFRTTGKTIEFEFATRDVLDYDANVLSCWSGDRGFNITAQQMLMASEQSSIGTRYKENEHIRVSIVAEKKSENRLILCYINGIMSGAVQYPEDDDFSQATPVGITIGSNDCTVDLYAIRAYDNSLTRHQILDNWIADTQDPRTRSARFDRNDVHDVYGQIVIEKLPDNLCYLVLRSEELPQFKGDKKPVSGYFVDPMHPERNFSFAEAQNDVQGTSSQYYYRKNYKIKFKEGFVLYNGSTAEVYSMNNDAIPVATFTMKADVASSEGAFNVILSMLYNILCPFKTPAQEADHRVRQTIEGFPIVIFWESSNGVKFLGKYNFNNDKGTEEVFGFKPGDESWEILQNGTARVGWHSADFSDSGWKTDFEARYPEDNVDTTRLQALAEWLVSTDTDQATGNSIEPVEYDGITYTNDTVEYRLAKYSAELSDHFVEEALIFYYLFTEMFLSIDQREKNAFPTYIAELDRWIVLFYDADSSLGTDNKGNLAFDYYLEDIDYTEGGDPVYNGQNSVLWKNLRATRYNEIMAMYQELRTSNKVNYEFVSGMFSNHQDTWPEAIFNEDMYVKCLEPLILDGDGLYLPMLQGKKEQWIKWWLYNRFRYLDSKYITGTSMTNRITIRAHQKANVTLTSYVNMYGHVYFNAAMAEHRMERGVPYEFEWPASGAEDPVIGINDADLLTNLGDLSPLMVELIDVSGAPHITNLKIGDGAADYANYSLNSVTVGNNKLLRTLDIRNCPNMTAVPDVSGCTNIEEIYAEGSAITGIKLPNGGVLKTLHLPETVVSLQVINQPKLADFTIPSYNQLTTLRLENAGVLSSAAIGILSQVQDNSRVRLLDINYEAADGAELETFLTRLNAMRGLDENGGNMDNAQISGYIHVTELNTKQAEMVEVARATYPSLTIEYDSVRNFFVEFRDGDTLLERIENIPYGGSATYSKGTPTKESDDPNVEWRFVKWSEDTGYVTDDMIVYAEFANVGFDTLRLIFTGFNGDYVNDSLTQIMTGPFAAQPFTTATFLVAKTVDKNTFTNCINLRRANFPQATSIGGTSHEGVFGGGYYSGNSNTPIEIADFGAITVFGSHVFSGCNKFKTLIIRTGSVATMGANMFNTANGPGPMAKGDGYIYVPRNLVDSYKSATGWSEFGNQFRALEDYTVDGTITGEFDVSKI